MQCLHGLQGLFNILLGLHTVTCIANKTCPSDQGTPEILLSLGY